MNNQSSESFVQFEDLTIVIELFLLFLDHLLLFVPNIFRFFQIRSQSLYYPVLFFFFFL
jgi:hypothetical protein